MQRREQQNAKINSTCSFSLSTICRHQDLRPYKFFCFKIKKKKKRMKQTMTNEGREGDKERKEIEFF